MKIKSICFTMNFNATVFLILFIMFLTGCASMSTMQTARTTEKGNVGYGFGAGVVNSEIPLGTLDTLKISAPFLEVGARYGITDKLDVGAKITIIGTATVDVKYQFLGNKESKFASSVGLGGGYLSISSNDSKSKIYDAMLPIYFSYHPIDWFSLYFSPKYVFRINSYSAANNQKGLNSSHWYGATGGLRLGKKVAFLAEYSYFGNSQIPQPYSQITCGIAIGIK
jgi:hypothetical protein